jgi:hypothetical protein
LPLTHAIPRARPTIAWTQLPDGAVLFSPESEVYYAVNQAGALIWELLASGEGAYDLDGLSRAVHERFPDAGLEQIRNDVEEILSDFAQNQLLAEPERNVA